MIDREQALVHFYASFRGRVPSVVEALQRQPFAYWMLNGIALGLSLLYYFVIGGPASLVLVGLLIGAVFRDIGWMLRFKRDWPILDRLLDWQAIALKQKEWSSS